MTFKHTMGDATQLTPDIKIFELIELDHSLLTIFARLGIKLPFGDVSVGEVCKREGYSAELFMMLCRMHIDPDYRPADELLSEDMLPQIVSFLRATHRHYTERMLPHAAVHLEEILGYCNDLSRSTLHRFYDDYVRCVEQHLDDEEQLLFSAIVGDNGACVDKTFNLDMPHSDIDDRTNDIASLVVKCLPEEAPTELRYALLKDIYLLREDLRRHALIESYLLRPLIDKFVKCNTL